MTVGDVLKLLLTSPSPFRWDHWRTKAKTLEESVFFAWDVGVRDVIFECDSRIVSDIVNGLCEPPISIDGVEQKLQDQGLSYLLIG